jgi:hypothetical protein
MRPLFIITFALLALSTSAQNNKTKTMEVAVWDTYVTKKDGSVMHFDIIAPSISKRHCRYLRIWQSISEN